MGAGPGVVSTYNYATPWALVEAATSPTYSDRVLDGAALIAFVSRQCGNTRDMRDGRGRRTQLALDLQSMGPDMVDSYLHHTLQHRPPCFKMVPNNLYLRCAPSIVRCWGGNTSRIQC